MPKAPKPFPWFCYPCGTKTVYGAKIDYTTEINHEGHLIDLEVLDLSCGRCNVCGELLFSIESDDQIQKAKRAKIQSLGLVG